MLSVAVNYHHVAAVIVIFRMPEICHSFSLGRNAHPAHPIAGLRDEHFADRIFQLHREFARIAGDHRDFAAVGRTARA